MAQTLAKRPFIVSQLQNLWSKLLIINDEAHIGTPTKLLKQLPNAYLIGFTATPDYKVAKHLPLLYNNIVVGPQPQELVELGFLSPYYHYESKAASLTDLKQKNGEFTEESQFAAFSKPTVFAGLHKDLSNHVFHKAQYSAAVFRIAQNLRQNFADKVINARRSIAITNSLMQNLHYLCTAKHLFVYL